MNNYRCETCDKSTFTRGVNWLNGGVLCEGSAILPDGVATISEKGCASHSDFAVENVAFEQIYNDRSERELERS